MWGSDAGFALNKNTEPTHLPSVPASKVRMIVYGQMAPAKLS
jgi:hypothetical protein